jgi:hypothetical protein
MGIRVYILALLLLVVSAPASAGGGEQWCLIRDDTEACAFKDAEACYRAVARAGGYCRQNYKIAGVSGRSRFCLVTANKRQCSYNFRGGCLRAAAKINGGCVENTEEKLKKSWGKKNEAPEGFSEYGMDF